MAWGNTLARPAPHTSPLRYRRSRTWLGLALLAGSFLGGCQPPGTRALKPTRGFILISIDTLRADHLGCYGYSRPTSPFIDSLAQRGVLFENAIVQLPGTLPSHMSIFTGLYPEEHGVSPPAGVLPPDVPTLPELFRRQGYRTAGHSEGGYVHGGYGFARGFDEWSHESKLIKSDAERTFARGVDFLRRLGADERFFVFLHTYSVHDPYFPLDRHSSYPQEKYAALYWQGPEPETFSPTGPNLGAFNRGEKELSAEGLEFFKARYDASINYVDDVLRDFFAELSALGLSEEVTVIVTSDHGEELLDHGKLAHDQIYPECLRVPLIVLHPEITRLRRVAEIVASIDIAPTLLEMAGIETPPMSGRSLVDLLLGRERAEASEAYAISFGALSRALLRADDEGLHQFLLAQPPSEGEGSWMGRSITFDSPPGTLQLEASSYHVPRDLRVTVDGKTLEAVYKVQPGQWIPITVELPAVSQITLEADGCVSPQSLGAGEDHSCLAVLLRGNPLARFELFDLAADPGARQNRSHEAGRRLPILLRRLRSYDLKPVSTTPAGELDPELEERLRALGYLR